MKVATVLGLLSLIWARCLLSGGVHSPWVLPILALFGLDWCFAVAAFISRL